MARNAIVVGAGIAGLATARALALKGFNVRVFDRGGKATGASIRNFGMIWPVGQPDGELYDSALRSRAIWEDTCIEAGIWHETAGSLHLAYEDDEWNVLREIQSGYAQRPLRLVSPDEVSALSPNAVMSGLRGGLFSATEMIVDPREAIGKLPSYLNNTYGIEFFWDELVTSIDLPVITTSKRKYEADEVYVCSGADFQTLYPAEFASIPITRCKLQMMRLSAQEERMGPALCGGLSLGHYKSFEISPSLETLKGCYAAQYTEHKKWGIHVMVSQNGNGEFTIGDSHEYGRDPEPFDSVAINQLIIGYLASFAKFNNARVIESWNGIYPKLGNGEAYCLLHPAKGVTIFNGLGGAGMTLSFGLAERFVSSAW